MVPSSGRTNSTSPKPRRQRSVCLTSKILLPSRLAPGPTNASRATAGPLDPVPDRDTYRRTTGILAQCHSRHSPPSRFARPTVTDLARAAAQADLGTPSGTHMQMAGRPNRGPRTYFGNSGAVANRPYCAEHHGPASRSPSGSSRRARIVGSSQMQVRRFDPHLQISQFSCQGSRKPRLPASSIMSSPPSPGPMVCPVSNASLPTGLTASWL
jgi:hypothetical protein